MKISDYKLLDVWQLSINTVKDVYVLLRELPSLERYGLADQIRRSSVSIPSNIAEGHGRNSNKEFSRFLLIARGSVSELETQLILCCELGYISKDSCSEIFNKLQRISKMIYSLVNYLEKDISKDQRPKTNDDKYNQ